MSYDSDLLRRMIPRDDPAHPDYDRRRRERERDDGDDQYDRMRAAEDERNYQERSERDQNSA